jgi:hypothetical protein
MHSQTHHSKAFLGRQKFNHRGMGQLPSTIMMKCPKFISTSQITEDIMDHPLFNPKPSFELFGMKDG